MAGQQGEEEEGQVRYALRHGLAEVPGQVAEKAALLLRLVLVQARQARRAGACTALAVVEALVVVAAGLGRSWTTPGMSMRGRGRRRGEPGRSMRGTLMKGSPLV